ncbi:peptidoglycan bridge formation glycyltransferase FemA/FemB family protein [Candidatus Saccharibacteria bacterium]|nr:peptidoglycan bridge formation glycyltransferase FemA/FemB family protein [Candidatus Saccharibacteria bacterium]
MLHVKECRPADFDKYVQSTHPEANFLQSTNWGKVYELDGERVVYLGLFDDKQQVGATLAIIKRAKRGAYVELPGGPLADWSNHEQLAAFLHGVKALAKAEKCVFVRMRPNIPDTADNRQMAQRLGLHASPMHLHAEHTVMLDLEKSEEQLLADMRRQTRYEVRRADKLGIEVRSESSRQAFDDFYSLQLETARRQDFVPSSRQFILAQQEAFGELAQIYTASLNGEVLAKGLIILQAPEAAYNEAASTVAGRKLPGAYALQWRVIRDAKRAGLKRYNLFGIAPPNSPHHRYAGVTTFKTGFGGEQLCYLPAQDLIVKPIRYRFVHLLETIRKHRRHL